MRAKYCKCLNTYTIKECKCEHVPYYWAQGIGNLTGQNVGIFDETFDETFV